MIHPLSGFQVGETMLAATCWLVAANFAGYFAMLADKRRSEAGLWRIPEARLLGIAFIGGSIGTLLAGQLLRHKTRKQPFRAYLILIALFQIVAGLMLAAPEGRAMVMEVMAEIR